MSQILENNGNQKIKHNVSGTLKINMFGNWSCHLTSSKFVLSLLPKVVYSRGQF